MTTSSNSALAHRGAHAILVTPGAIDGYPPVQHQARLLARAGFAVEAITPLLPGRVTVAFSCPDVRITTIASGDGPAGKALRYARFCVAIARARRRAGPHAIEIAYDPLGMFYSDIAPFRPAFRVAHFHETLQRYGSAWDETRLGRAIAGYQLVITADEDRSEALRLQFARPDLPVLAVPNYPLRSTRDPTPPSASDRFEIIYAGAIGASQKLDLVVESFPFWPSHTILTVLGRAESGFVASLKARAQSLGCADRIHFPGWIDYADLESRLSAADLGILFLDPSYEQYRTALGASNKRYQYMQAGLPQIGDMNPGVPELLEGNGAGVCIRAYAPAEIAAAVGAYATNPARRRSEGDRARHLHLTQFHYERAFEPLLARILAATR